MRSFFYIAIISLLALSCNEFVKTQVAEPKISVDRASILADGKSRILVKVKMERELSPNQPIRLTTTDGLLELQPATANPKYFTDSSISPASSEISFFLISSSTPNDNVIVSAAINGLVSSTHVAFTPVCSDFIKIKLDRSKIDNDSIKIKISTYRNDLLSTPKNTRIQCTVNSAVGEIDEIIYTDESGEAITYLTLKDEGDSIANVSIIPSGLCAGAKGIDTTFNVR